MWIRIAEAANRYGVTRQYLQKLCNRGKIEFRKVQNRVEIETDVADQILTVGGKPPQKKIKKSPAAPKKKVVVIRKPAPKPEPELDFDEDFGEELDFDISSAKLTPVTKIDILLKKEKIEAQRIKNEYDRGRLVERDQVERYFFDTGRNIRDSLEAIPARISPLCVGKTQHEIEQTLIAEIKQTLTNLVQVIHNKTDEWNKFHKNS